MPTAQIQFSQGATTTTAGQSAIGYVTGTTVNFTDAAGAGATAWQWSIVGFPGPLGSAPSITNATTQTASLTPTTDGVYVIKLARTDGAVVTTDVRFFAIADADYGLVLPSSGMTGNMTNVGGSSAAQQAGWQGRADASTNIFADATFRFLRSRIGRFVGLHASVSFSSSSPSTVTVTDGTDKPWRLLSLTGSAVYTEQLDKTAPTEGKHFRYNVSLTAGAGGFILLNGVSGTTLLTLSAPPNGTITYSFDVIFDGTNWTLNRISYADPLALTKSREFQAVAGLQTTAQTTATRIGSVRIDPTKFPSNAQVTFQVALDVTSGMTATCQLYNVTDGGIVSSSALTSTSTTTQVVTSGALTLPSAQKDYEVQLFISSGTPGVNDHVDCTSAKVILTWA